MGKLDTTSTVTLILNGEQTKTSLKEVTQAVNATAAALSNMKKADDPKGYQQKIDLLGKLKQAQSEYRKEIFSGAQEQKGFFDDFKKGFSEIEEIAGRVTAGTLIYKGVNAALEGLSSLLNGSEEAYDEAQRTQVQLQQALRSTGGVAGESQKQLEKYQQTLMDQTGVDDDVIAKGEEMLLTFTNIRGKIYEQALPAIVDMTSALNGGKVSMEGIQATAIQVGKALNDPINGATALKKVGVTLDDQQKQQIKTFQESNNMMAAQGIILKELEKEFGGTAKAIANTDDIGKIQAFDTAIGNLKEKIGGMIAAGKSLIADFFLPTVQELSETGTEAEVAAKKYETASESLKDITNNISPLLDRYDQLKSKTSLTKEEHIELNDIIDKVNKALPGVASEFDSYGKAIDISTDRARTFIVEQKNMLKYLNREAIQKATEDLAKYTETVNSLSRQLKSGFTEDKISGYLQSIGLSKQAGALKLNENMRAEMQQRLADAGVLKAGAEAAIKKLNGEDDDVKPTVTPPKSGKTQQELDAEARKAEQEKKAREAYAAGVKSLNDELRQFNAEQLADEQSKNDKEVQSLENKYDKEIAITTDKLTKLRQNKNANPDDINKLQGQINDVGTNKDKAVADLKIKQAKDTADAIKKYQDDQAVNYSGNLDKELQKNKVFYDGLRKNAASNDIEGKINIEAGRIISNYNSTNAANLINEKKYQDELQQLKDDYAVLNDNRELSESAKIQQKYDKELAAFKDQLNQKLITQAEYDKLADQAGANKKLADQKVQDKKASDEKEFYLNTVSETENAAFTIASRNRQADENAAIKSLEDQKNVELANKNLTATQKQAIEDKYAKQEAAIKLKAWKADQKAAEEQAIINGAVAVLKATSQTGILAPFVIPGIIAETAIQVAMIASQKPPEFAKGGLIVDGPSHSDGGVSLFNNQTGQQIAEVEGGEAFMALSKETTANNAGLIKELLYNSQYRNGAPVKINTELATISATSQYRNGGAFTSTGAQFSNTAFPAGNANSSGDNLNELKGLRKAFEDFAAKPWEFPMRAFQEAQQRQDDIVNRAKGK